MADWRETNFGSLSIPLGGLRAHADLNSGRIAVPETLKNHQEIQEDLEAALSAGRREDPNWLTGFDVAGEVNDEKSAYHGRSAYRIFARAASFESILTATDGRFVRCPNQEIFDLSAPIKNLRDYAFQKSNEGLLSLFPETVKERQLFTDQLSRGLETARSHGDLDVLSGVEALDEIGDGCDNTDALDLFWQSAFASAWIRGDKTIPVIRIGGEQSPQTPSAEPQAPSKPVQPFNPFASNYFSSPFSSPGTSAPLFGGGFGNNPFANPLGQQQIYPFNPPYSQYSYGGADDTTQLVKDVGGGVMDAALAGGGIVFQRGVVEEYKMTFRPVSNVTPQRTDLVLAEVDRIHKVSGGDTEPMDLNAFRKDNRAMFEKGRKEAEILWERGKVKAQPPTEVVRTGVKRGWVRGAISPRRIFGWVTAAYGIVDMGFRLFRKDSRGLDGPLTDAGANPLGAKLAMVGVGAGLTATVILTGGMAVPVLIAFSGLSVYGLTGDIDDGFEDANAVLDAKFNALENDPSREKPGPARDQSPSIVNWFEFSNKPPRADYYI